MKSTARIIGDTLRVLGIPVARVLFINGYRIRIEVPQAGVSLVHNELQRERMSGASYEVCPLDVQGDIKHDRYPFYSITGLGPKPRTGMSRDDRRKYNRQTVIEWGAL